MLRWYTNHVQRRTRIFVSNEMDVYTSVNYVSCLDFVTSDCEAYNILILPISVSQWKPE